MHYLDPIKIQQLWVLPLILLMGGLIFQEILPFLFGVLGGVTIYVLMRKWMLRLVKKHKANWKRNTRDGLVECTGKTSCGYSTEIYRFN